jgi:hypothetical protein
MHHLSVQMYIQWVTQSKQVGVGANFLNVYITPRFLSMYPIYWKGPRAKRTLNLIVIIKHVLSWFKMR